MTTVLYRGCPAPDRADTEKQLGSADVAIVDARRPDLTTEAVLAGMAVARVRARPEIVGSEYV